MPPSSNDLVPLARIDATVWEKAQYTYIRHKYYGWRKEAPQRYTWRRSYKRIGRGGFGEVYKEKCVKGSSKGAVRAVKALQKPTTGKARMMDYSRELEAVARFSHSKYAPFFVQSDGWYETSEMVYIVMELVELGSLEQYIGDGLPEGECRAIMRQLLQGLSFMHDTGYTHRDLKPQNLLVVGKGPLWHIKITDFGLSKRVTESLSSLHTFAGTPGYMAPELRGFWPSDGIKDRSYTSAVDIWAVGIILFQLLTGDLPFPSQDPTLLGQYAQGVVSLPIGPLNAVHISSEGERLVQACLTAYPDSRPSSAMCLEHTWWSTTLPSARDPLPGGFNTWGTADWTTQDVELETVPRLHSASQSAQTFKPEQVSCYNIMDIEVQGHGTMYCELSPDGRTLATVFYGSRKVPLDTSDIGRLTLWDTNTGALTKFEHEAFVRTAAFAPNDALLAYIRDGEVLLWDTKRSKDRRMRTTVRANPWPAIEFHPQSRRKQLKFLAKRVLAMHQDEANVIDVLRAIYIGQLSFSPNGRLLAIATSIGTRVQNLATDKVVTMNYMALSDAYLTIRITFCPTGRTLATKHHSLERIHADAEEVFICLWDPLSGELIARLDPIEARRTSPDERYNFETATTLVFSPDGMLLASVGNEKGTPNGCIYIWNMSTKEKPARPLLYQGEQSPPVAYRDLAFSRDGSKLAALDSLSGRVDVYQLRPDQTHKDVDVLRPDLLAGKIIQHIKPAEDGVPKKFIRMGIAYNGRLVGIAEDTRGQPKGKRKLYIHDLHAEY